MLQKILISISLVITLVFLAELTSLKKDSFAPASAPSPQMMALPAHRSPSLTKYPSQFTMPSLPQLQSAPVYQRRFEGETLIDRINHAGLDLAKYKLADRKSVV